MRLRPFVLFLSCLTALALAEQSSACSMIRKPVVSLPPGRVVFRGVVRGYVEAAPRATGDAAFHALLVERDPRDPVFVAATLVEVRPFYFDASCDHVGHELDDLRAKFPVGVRVAVVGDLLDEAAALARRPVVVSCSAFGELNVDRPPHPTACGGFLDFHAYTLAFLGRTPDNVDGNLVFEHHRALVALARRMEPATRLCLLRSLASSICWSHEDWRGQGLAAYDELLAGSRLADADRQALHDEFAAAHPRRDP